jgi:hypothetical protein
MTHSFSRRSRAAVLATTFVAAGNALAQRPSPVIRVIGHDYALIAPDSIRAANQITFEFDNQGKRDHELIIGLLRPGMGAKEIMATHQKGAIGFRQLQNEYLDGAAVGMLYAAPGTRSPARLTVPALPGRSYLLLCQLRDSVGMQQHVLLGMFKVLRVQ